MQVTEFLKKNTLSRDYFRYAAIVAIFVVGFSAWRAYEAYKDLSRDKELRYETEGQQIAEDLEETLNYLENFLSLVGNDISQLDRPTAEKIAPILRKSWPKISNSGYNYFTWSVLDFTNPDGMIIASSTQGVLEPPQALPKERKWLEFGPKQPGKLIFSDPAIGVLTKKYILPTGYGVLNKNGKYVGSISIGLALSNLTKKLESPLSTRSASFVMLDPDFKIITQSTDNLSKLPADFFVSKLDKDVIKQSDRGTLENSIKIDNVTYNYYRHIDGYPFIFLIGDNQDFLDKEFNQQFMPRIEQSIILGIFFIVLLYFFQRKIIKPVKALSDAAVEISQGRTDVKMPETDIYEYQVLARKLSNIQEFVHKLTHAQTELQEALKAKANFLSNMSHEFRTPLNAVIGFSETIKSKLFGEINDKYAEYIENINEQGNYLLELIEDILDASKIDAGKMKLDEEPFDFKRLVRESLKSVQMSAVTKKIELVTEIPDDLPYIRADRTKIKQVLLNLMSNAVKFTHEGGTVTVRAKIKDEFIFEVEDTGIGIPKEDLKMITKRFMQVDNDYTKKQRGTGLGMSISKDIAELHGGKLKIKSEVGRGTKISVRLPKERIIFGG
jgi:signal transduction histidine kinase